MYLTKHRSYRSLLNSEIIRQGDLVEDFVAGDRQEVRPDTFYGILKGWPVSMAKEIPAVFDVLRVEE